MARSVLGVAWSRGLFLGLFVGGLAFGAGASHEDHERCRNNDRDCLIAGANSYLDALVSGDAEHVRLAPQAWRVNGGSVTVNGETEVREGIESFECNFVADIDHKRWVVDQKEHQAIAFYDLYADATRNPDCGPPLLPREQQVPTWVAERWRVLDGLIYEIEVVVSIDAPGATCVLPERRDTDFGPAGCGDNSRECVIETATKYLDALLSHDASEVPLRADAWRIENCGNSGNSGQEIRDGLESSVMDVIVDIEYERWFVEGENAVVIYVLWTHPSGDPNSDPADWQATYIFERFRLDDGLIKEIEAVFGLPPDDPGVQPNYPDVDGDGFSHIDDNCPDRSNPGQDDTGGLVSSEPDGIGDACQCGDVTANGEVNGQDGNTVRRFGVDSSSNPLFVEAGNCDVNGNGQCNGQDANWIRRAALGLNAPGFGQDCPNANPSVTCSYCSAAP